MPRETNFPRRAGPDRALAGRAGNGFAGAVTPRSPDPLHGVTLEKLLQELVAAFGWAELGRRIPVNCFRFEPSLTSSLRFLRRTPWARAKVEDLYREWKRANPR